MIESRDIKHMACVERIEQLEKENKNLKEINESQNEEIQRFKDNAMADMTEITKLEVENKSLKEELSKLKEKYGDLDY